MSDAKFSHCKNVDEVLTYVKGDCPERGEPWFEKALEHMPWLRKRKQAIKQAIKLACSELYYDETDEVNDVSKVIMKIKEAVTGW